MKYYALIVAGGSGTRMGAALPKQFLLLSGKPVLMHTIEAFHSSDLKPEIVLVLNIDFHPYWEKLCKEQDFNIPHKLVKAGRQRFHSVKNGLKDLKNQSIIAVHDGVRPLISNKLISDSFREAALNGNAVCAVQASDSVRRLYGNFSEALNREEVFLVQTPQTFECGILKKAYKQPYRTEFTDDASVVEKAGIGIHLIPGEKSNLKITYPEDIRIAEVLLKEAEK